MSAVRSVVALSAILVVGCSTGGIAPHPQLLGVVVVSASAIAPADAASGLAGCGAVAGTGASVAGAARAASADRNTSFEPRWREDAGRSVRVHIEDAKGLAGWTPANRQEVLSAVNAWELAGAPVNFVVVNDGEPADVRVHWIERFDSRYEGWTNVSWDRDGWLTRADMELSLRSPAGALLSAREREQVVTHEFGHVLGLSHSGSTASIMSPVVRVTGIAQIDAAALRALYSDQAGPARAGPNRQSCPTADSEPGRLKAAQRGPA